MGVVEFVNKTYDRGAWMEADKKKKIRGRPFLFVYNTYFSVKKMTNVLFIQDMYQLKANK